MVQVATAPDKCTYSCLTIVICHLAHHVFQVNRGMLLAYNEGAGIKTSYQKNVQGVMKT